MNEETKRDESESSVVDLPVTQNQAEEAKGGGEIVPTDQPSLNFAKIRY